MAAAKQSFRDLLRHSKLAAFSPAAQKQQVFAAPAKVAATSSSGTLADSGLDWGLKRAVPNSMAADFLQIQDFDTEFGFTRLRPGQVQAMRYQVYAEAFGGQGNDSVSGAHEPPPNLYRMSNEEFQQILNDAKNRRDEYRRSLEQYPIRRSDPSYAAQFLGLDLDPQMEAYPCTFSYVQYESKKANDGDEESSDAAVHPEPVQVDGRVVNRVDGGFAVAVAGVIGFLPTTTGRYMASLASLNAQDRMKLHRFYLQEVQWSREGRPHVVLSLTAPKRLTLSMPKSSRVGSLEKEQQELKSLLEDLIESTKSTEQPRYMEMTRRERNPRPRTQHVPENSAELHGQITDLLNSLSGKKK